MIPPDPVLQKMTNAQLQKLWDSRPKYAENFEWIRVAKEIRYRNKFKLGSIK